MEDPTKLVNDILQRIALLGDWTRHYYVRLVTNPGDEEPEEPGGVEDDPPST